jgi:hypothetical protein
MEYFTNEFSDFDGYMKQLMLLKNRFNNEVYTFLTTNSFHDSHLFSLSVNNMFNPHIDTEEEENDPTQIEAHLLHSSGNEYKVIWQGVNKILMDYDILRNTYENSIEIAFGGARGLDDWISDEITAYDDVYLSHKIIFASDTKLDIRFKTINILRI